MGMGKRFSNPSKNGSTRTRPILKMVWVGLTRGSCGLTRFVDFFSFCFFFYVSAPPHSSKAATLQLHSASTSNSATALCLHHSNNSATALCLHHSSNSATALCLHQQLCNCTLPPPLQQRRFVRFCFYSFFFFFSKEHWNNHIYIYISIYQYHLFI